MTLDDLAALARSSRPPTDASQATLTRSYFATYSANVDHFAGQSTLGDADALIAASMSYAWLPRAVRVDPAALPGAVEAMNAARDGNLTLEATEAYARLVERSVIAASKALHFVAPEVVPIYDSKVHLAFFGTKIPYSMKKRFGPFLQYAEQLRRLAADAAFAPKVRTPFVAAFEPFFEDGSPIAWSELSSLRVAELCLFYSSSAVTKPAR